VSSECPIPNPGGLFSFAKLSLKPPQRKNISYSFGMTEFDVFCLVPQYVVTSSSKERVQLTLCPVGDLHHPNIEVDCEPGHPFMVDKKGKSTNHENMGIQ
jgi:hypothetical protein